MAHQKVCKQGRCDIKVKVNIQSPIPTSFYTTELSCEKDAGRRLHTFWCAIPTSFTFLMFLSLYFFENLKHASTAWQWFQACNMPAGIRLAQSIPVVVGNANTHNC